MARHAADRRLTHPQAAQAAGIGFPELLDRIRRRAVG
jgi:hypothetical protein